MKMHQFRSDNSPMLNRRRFGALSAGSIAAMAAPGQALAEVKPLGLVLPTRNRAIYTSDPSRFYTYIDRTFEGRKMKVWQGGKYGYVRNPVRTSSGIVYTKFHEGVDISPVSRDKNGEPLDTVRSIAHGKVVHTSANPRHSSYGSYVVVEHDWGYGRFYSLYAHLRKITAAKGAKVGPGSPLGVLGYTGPGLDRTVTEMGPERFQLELRQRCEAQPRHLLAIEQSAILGLRHAHCSGEIIEAPISQGIRALSKSSIRSKSAASSWKAFRRA